MKTIISALLIFLTLLQSGCATLFGGGISDCQRHKPDKGQPTRPIRGAAMTCDIVFGFIIFAPITVGVDFLTGAIYKPCTYIASKDTIKKPLPIYVESKSNNYALISSIPLSADESAYFNKGYIIDSIENGLGQYIKINFTISSQDAYDIKNSAGYKNSKKISLIQYIYGKIDIAAIDTKYKYKNTTSFNIPLNTKGAVFYDTSDGLFITFPCQGQNGYGGMILGKSYTTEKDGTTIDDGN